jgi:hypothetical protein
MRAKRDYIIVGVIVLAAVLGLRLPWIFSDPGVQSFWDFGYFLTDEGYYTGDGRLGFLSGNFFSVTGESMSFYKLPVPCILSYLSYSLFGLESWAPRVPQLILSLWLWLLVYHMSAKRTKAWIAGLLVILVSSTPPFLSHERSVSSDFMMGVFAISSLWAVDRKNGIWAGVLGAVLFSAALFTKTSALGLVPMIFFSSLFHKEKRWVRTAAFMVGSAVIISLISLTLHLYVKNIADDAGLTLSQALEMGYRVDPPPKISFEKMDSYLRSWSVFLKWPVMGRVSFFSVWMVAIPGLVLILKLLRSPLKRWKRAELFSASFLIYFALIAIHGKCNVRYFLPVFALTPIYLVETRHIFLAPDKRPLVWRVSFCLLFIALSFLVFWKSPLGSIEIREVVYSQFSNPKHMLWLYNYPMLFFYGISGLLAGFFCADKGNRFLLSSFGLLAGVWLAQLIQTCSVFLRSHVGFPEAMVSDYRAIQMLIIFQLFGLFYLILFFSRRIMSWRWWYGGFVLFLLMTYVGNPYWRRSVPELMKRDNTHQLTQQKLSESIPDNSVIIGARAQSIFLESECSLIPYLYMGKRAEFFWEQIVERMKREPERPYLVLLEPQEPHSWQDLDKCKHILSYKVVGKVVLPSFADGSNSEMYIAQLFCKP